MLVVSMKGEAMADENRIYGRHPEPPASAGTLVDSELAMAAKTIERIDHDLRVREAEVEWLAEAIADLREQRERWEAGWAVLVRALETDAPELLVGESLVPADPLRPSSIEVSQRSRSSQYVG